MSSSGGGIVVHPVGLPADKEIITKSDGQMIADCLTACAQPDLAAKIQAVVNNASQTVADANGNGAHAVVCRSGLCTVYRDHYLEPDDQH